MKIDFSCPVELLNIHINNKAVCQFLLNNLAEQSVNSVELVLLSYDLEDEIIYEQRERLRNFIAETRIAQELSFDVETIENTSYTMLLVEKVWFNDGTIWRSGEADEYDYELNLLPNGKTLSNLRSIVGQDAICYPSEQGEVWVCVCGRANLEQENICVRCDREKLKVFTDFNKESIEASVKAIKEKNDSDDKKARLESAKKIENLKILEQRKKKRNKKMLISFIFLCFCILLLYLGIYYGIPAYNNIQADNLIKNSEFKLASEKLKALPERYDTADRLKQCDYCIAQDLLESDNQSELFEAYEKFNALNGYENSKELALQARYKLGEIYLNQEDYVKAQEVYKEIIDYSDSRIKLNQAEYGMALNLMKNGEYDNAKDIFTKIGNYMDSQEQLLVCNYNLGKIALENKEFDKAADLLQKAANYEDANEKLIEVFYAQAGILFEKKEFASAGDLYLKVAESENSEKLYKDAKTKANACLYEAGKQAMYQADYAKAIEYFSGILSYVDSKKLHEEAVYSLAEQYLAESKPENVLELLKGMESNEKIINLINKAEYSIADKLYENGEYEKAREVFKNIAAYSDADLRAKQINYVIAEKEFDKKDYAKAAQLFEELEDFSDSESRKNQSLYNIAMELAEKGDYDKAKEGFLALDEYSDSKTQADKVQYQQAMAYKESGNLELAIEKFSEITDYSDSETQLSETIYQQAKKYQDNNDIEKAMEYFEKIKQYEDSELQFLTCKYNLAEKAYANGDVLKAAELFNQVGDWRDAPARMERAYDEYFESPAMLARKAGAEGDYQAAYNALKAVNFSIIPEKYKDLQEIYYEANYQLANQAMENKKAFLALSYYQNILNYKDVNKIKLKQKTFKLIGRWETADGVKALFNEDGSCEIDGKKYSQYFVEAYNLYLGTDDNNLEIFYSISNLGNNSFAIREKNTEERKYQKFSRIKEYQEDIEEIAAPEAMENTPPPSLEPVEEIKPTVPPLIIG